MRAVKGPDDVKVGDLVEFDPEPTKPVIGHCRAYVRGTVSAVRDASITVRRDGGGVSIVRYQVTRYQVTRKTRGRYTVNVATVHPIAVVEPRDLWLARRPACVDRFASVVEIAIGKMPRGVLGADAFAAIAREVEAWLREEPA